MIELTFITGAVVRGKRYAFIQAVKWSSIPPIGTHITLFPGGPALAVKSVSVLLDGTRGKVALAMLDNGIAGVAGLEGFMEDMVKKGWEKSEDHQPATTFMDFHLGETPTS